MTESATAESAYFHTLNARPFFFPIDTRDRDQRLAVISSHLLELPPEIRFRIYELSFGGNRVAVTASQRCYCASDATGPYRPDHRYLLTDISGQVRQDAQQAFIQLATWELHCAIAFNQFVGRMTFLNALTSVRHIRVNVFETSREYWSLPFEKLPCLASVTFSPWQKGWTIDINGAEDSPALSDSGVMERVRDVLNYKDGYEPVRDLIKKPRAFKVLFIFPIRYRMKPSSSDRENSRWQLRVWRADLDTNTVDREFRDVHLVQEATLD